MSDKEILNEMEAIIGNLSDKDEDTAEYSRAVNNASKLQQMAIGGLEYEEKVRRNSFDEKMRVKQFNLEKKKNDEAIEQRKADRDLETRRVRLEEHKAEMDQQRINNQHEEKMKELEISELKLKNENIILNETSKKAERDSKARKLEFWIGAVVKVGLTIGTLFLYRNMHKDEIDFERKENGLTPKRCKGYDDIIIKASQKHL